MLAVKTIITPVQALWAMSFAAQCLICGMLVFRRHYRTLPFFTTYIVLNLCQALFLYAIYARYPYSSRVAYLAGWWSQAITMVARGLATMEVLRLTLNSYAGIWGMAWRIISAISGMVLLGVILLSQGNAAWALMEANRGYHVIFATVILTCLVLIRYYFIEVASVYKGLAAGFCFDSCVAILLNTILQGVLYGRSNSYESIWSATVLSSYLAVQGIWIVALRRPLPARTRAVQLPVSDYRFMRPAINYQLQAINDRLAQFWKLEGPRN
jgi:hypothetical protein